MSKITSSDCVAEIVKQESSNAKDWKRVSKRNDGNNTLRQFDNKKINKSCVVTTTNQDSVMASMAFYSQIIKPAKKSAVTTKPITSAHMAPRVGAVIKGIEWQALGKYSSVYQEAYTKMKADITESGWDEFVTETPVSAGTVVVVIDSYKTGEIEDVIKITEDAFIIKPGDCNGFTCDQYTYVTADKKEGIMICDEPWEIDEQDFCENMSCEKIDGKKILKDIKKKYGKDVVIVSHN